MVDRESMTRWIEGYRAAAASDDPEQIKALFAEDAEYWDGPFGEPWRGHDEIVRKWTESSDRPYEWDFDFEVFAVDGSCAVAQIEYRYKSPQAATYRNVWLIDLDDEGRARLFKDYWIEDPATKQDP